MGLGQRLNWLQWNIAWNTTHGAIRSLDYRSHQFHLLLQPFNNICKISNWIELCIIKESFFLNNLLFDLIKKSDDFIMSKVCLSLAWPSNGLNIKIRHIVFVFIVLQSYTDATFRTSHEWLVWDDTRRQFLKVGFFSTFERLDLTLGDPQYVA